MSNVSFIHGDQNALQVADTAGVVSVIDMALPFDQADFSEGSYQTILEAREVEVKFYRAASIEEDFIAQVGKDLTFGGSYEVPHLPFIAATDHRGQYPAFFARIVFPWRIAAWLEPSNQVIPADVAIMGPPPDGDKIKALRALNQVLSSPEYGRTVGAVSYDEVTTFISRYFLRPSTAVLVLRIAALTSPSAYKDALVEHLLPGFDFTSLFAALPVQRRRVTSISTEQELTEAVRSVLTEALKLYVESRRWIEAFWDGHRTVHVNGQGITIPATPKPESKIQPTLHVLLDLLLKPSGIQVVRESDEGIGSIDFRCLYTTPTLTALNSGVEFKLAHHGELRKGMRSQLPDYLRAIPCRSGTFLVLWFKDRDGKFFKQPARDKAEMIKWLEDEARKASDQTALDIEAVLIDASIKPSASQ